MRRDTWSWRSRWLWKRNYRSGCQRDVAVSLLGQAEGIGERAAEEEGGTIGPADATVGDTCC